MENIKAWAILCKETKEKDFDILGFTRLYVYVGEKRGKNRAEYDKDIYIGREGYNYKIVPCLVTIQGRKVKR